MRFALRMQEKPLGVTAKNMLVRFRRRIASEVAFQRYKKGIGSYKALIRKNEFNAAPGLLVVSGKSMNIVWAQIWTFLSIAGWENGLRPYVLTSRKSPLANRYYRLLDIKPIYLEDFLGKSVAPLPSELREGMQKAQTPRDFRNLEVKGVPFGEMALSSYFRNAHSGQIDTSSKETRGAIVATISDIWFAYCVAQSIFTDYQISASFFTETFMEEYGGFYFAAIDSEITTIRFAGTVRDDGIIAEHRNRTTARHHHGALHASTWSKLKNLKDFKRIDAQVSDNFLDRYGTRWHRSKRNFPSSEDYEPKAVRKILGLQPGRKTAIIFSHILYDTLFFFGEDLFDDYASWLVETVKAAAKNEEIEWFVKVHPSNAWRGEDEKWAGTPFSHEEHWLIHQHLGTLPGHVNIIPAESDISPVSWMKFVDYGITVRGTAGLEMASMGKGVVTAGKGRYEGNGFTIDPKSREEYLETLQNLHKISNPALSATNRAIRYAFGLFVAKPFLLSSLCPQVKAGIVQVRASDDLTYVPTKLQGNQMPRDLEEFANFLLDDTRPELITGL